MKRILSLLLSAVMLVSAMSLVDFSAFAASKLPATSITSLSAKDNGFKIKWKKKSSITGYQIQYSTNSKFKKKDSKTIKVKQVKTNSKRIKGLKVAKKYYVRVRTYKLVKKKSYYSSWSKKKSVTITPANTISAATTTSQAHCTNNSNHSIKCGNIGRWFNSRSDIETYWKNQCNALAEKWDKGEISDSEYYSKSPYGYECWSCSYCGKWTGNFKYR